MQTTSKVWKLSVLLNGKWYLSGTRITIQVHSCATYLKSFHFSVASNRPSHCGAVITSEKCSLWIAVRYIRPLVRKCEDLESVPKKD